MDKVIAVSCEFGSGGRELGVELAEKLDIPFYDKELISMAANDVNIAEEAFQNYDERIVIHSPLDRQCYHAFSDIYKMPMSGQIFVTRSNAIRRLVAHGLCVIVGRCVDMILDDSINLLIYSRMGDRVKHMLILEPGSDKKEMKRRIWEVDWKHKKYYQYYTGSTWDWAQNYCLCLGSGLTGVDGYPRAVLAYLGELLEQSMGWAVQDRRNERQYRLWNRQQYRRFGQVKN